MNEDSAQKAWLWWVDVYGPKPLSSEWQERMESVAAARGGTLKRIHVSELGYPYVQLMFEFPDEASADAACAAFLSVGAHAEPAGGQWAD
jgi:hypothetical protein